MDFSTCFAVCSDICDLGLQIARKWKLMFMILHDFCPVDLVGLYFLMAIRPFIELVVLMVVVLKGVLFEIG